jgi:hypothetical protein
MDEIVLTPLQEKLILVAAKFPQKVVISATMLIFIGGTGLPVNHMPVNLVAEISARKFV